MAKERPQREYTSLEWEETADGDGLALKFRLVKVTEWQVKYRGHWYSDSDVKPNPVREVVAELDRSQLAEHIADAAKNLAFVGDYTVPDEHRTYPHPDNRTT